MTNFDLDLIYEFLTLVRFDPKRPSNIVRLDGLLDALDQDSDTFEYRDIFFSKDDECYDRRHLCFFIISEPYRKIKITDEKVYVFFRLYFLELKYLCLTKRYDHVFYLIDRLDNFPEMIIKNNLELPVKKLKRCLLPYWIKYDKSFLKSFMNDLKAKTGDGSMS